MNTGQMCSRTTRALRVNGLVTGSMTLPKKWIGLLRKSGSSWMYRVMQCNPLSWIYLRYATQSPLYPRTSVCVIKDSQPTSRWKSVISASFWQTSTTWHYHRLHNMDEIPLTFDTVMGWSLRKGGKERRALETEQVASNPPTVQTQNKAENWMLFWLQGNMARYHCFFLFFFLWFYGGWQTILVGALPPPLNALPLLQMLV